MLDVQAASDKGNKRDHNEDMLLVGDTIFRDGRIRMEFDSDCLLTFAVADGMGGHNAGEVASEMALNSLVKFTGILGAGYSEGHLCNMLNDWAERMHEELTEEGFDNPERRGMGTTLCGFFIYDKKYYAINAGDSRLYHFRNGILQQISKDHSLASQDPTAPSNIITNALGGGGESAFLDVENITDRLEDNDILLACSDGLSDMVEDEGIRELLNNSCSAQDLIDAANDNGGKDNISVILAKMIKAE